jgi:hypothetical protein
LKQWRAKLFCSFLVATIVSMSGHVAALSNDSTFTDIENSYAKDAIIRLVEQGIVQGVDDSRFDPKGPLTRSQFVTMLVRSLQLPVESTAAVPAQFTDIQGWAVPYIASAYTAGFIDGVGMGKFNPDGILTREQAAKILVAALGKSDPSMKLDKHAVPPFTDADRIADWAKPYVALAAELNLINGQPDGSFNPKGIANREMAAVLSVNFLDAVQNIRNRLPGVPAPISDIVDLPAPTDLSPDETGLSIVPDFNPVFVTGQEQSIKVLISGQISQADLQRKAKLYASFHSITSKEITFGTIAGLGKPEIVQEGTGSQPLIVAWGIQQGFELGAYLLGNSDLYINLHLPVTLHKKGLISSRLELKTADAVASELISLNMLLQAGESFLQPPGDTPAHAISTMLGQPLPAQAGQRITIPVTIKGTVPSQYLSDLAAVQLRILDQHNVLSPDEVSIENVSGFGHPNIVFNGKDYLEIQFDQYTRLEDLQQDLVNGISFDLNITLRQTGSFGMSASLNRVDENGRTKGPIDGGNVIIITVE